NCTFAGNSAPRGGAILSVSNNGTSFVTVRNCTVTNNTATSAGHSADGGGGYYGEGAVGNSLHHFANTILAGNHNAVNPDLRGYGTSEGHNLVGNLGQIGSGFSNGVNGDLVGVDPEFSPFGLEDNGGATDTWSLRATSPARDAGDDALAPATDQRGNARAGVSDIGALELPDIVPTAGEIERVANDLVISFGNAIKGSVYRLERKFDPNALWPSEMMPPPAAEFPGCRRAREWHGQHHS
ncbi:MAG: hypothetical protein LC642_07685, partial [Verrucomicrobiaceae bacterium]|nr:hypothetical protein [Verrucomicrobiaceae bacterium]